VLAVTIDDGAVRHRISGQVTLNSILLAQPPPPPTDAAVGIDTDVATPQVVAPGATMYSSIGENSTSSAFRASNSLMPSISPDLSVSPDCSSDCASRSSSASSISSSSSISRRYDKEAMSILESGAFTFIVDTLETICSAITHDLKSNQRLLNQILVAAKQEPMHAMISHLGDETGNIAYNGSCTNTSIFPDSSVYPMDTKSPLTATLNEFGTQVGTEFSRR
jgi:hypothetical protein